MPLPTLRHFKPWEFHHPELIDAEAAHMLDEIRERFGQPVIVTDDARVPGQQMPSGAGAKSFHLVGCAFDLRIRHLSWGQLWDLAAAVFSVAADLPPGQAMEFELVYSARDKHAHVALAKDGRRHRLIVQAD